MALVCFWFGLRCDSRNRLRASPSASLWMGKGVLLAARRQLVAAPQGSAGLRHATPSMRKLTVRSCKRSSSGRNDSRVCHWEFLTLLGVNAVPSSGWASLVAQQSRTCLQCRRGRFDPWVRKIPWRREWQPPPWDFLARKIPWRGAWRATVHRVPRVGHDQAHTYTSSGLRVCFLKFCPRPSRLFQQI